VCDIKRHTYIKRDIHMLKETYVFQKRHTYIKRDIHISKESYIYQKRHTSIKRDIHMSKETQVCQTRHTYTKRNLRISKEMHVFQKRYTFMERDIYMCVWYTSCDVCDIPHASSSYPMGWLRSVGLIKLYVSFANEPYKRDDILQKRPIIPWMLLTVATP